MPAALHIPCAVTAVVSFSLVQETFLAETCKVEADKWFLYQVLECELAEITSEDVCVALPDCARHTQASRISSPESP